MIKMWLAWGSVTAVGLELKSRWSRRVELLLIKMWLALVSVTAVLNVKL